MTKPARTGKRIARRYREMAAAARQAAETAKPRDRAVYLALARGWEALADVDDEGSEREPPARRK